MRESWNEAEVRTNSWSSETCYQWVSGAIPVQTIFTSVLSSTWECKSATIKSILVLRSSDFILNAHIVMPISRLKQILKITIISFKLVVLEIMKLSKMLNRLKSYWKKWKSMKKMVILWNTFKAKLMIPKDKWNLRKLCKKSKISISVKE